MSRSKIKQKVGVRKIVEDSITPLVTRENFVVMPDVYYAFTFQELKTRYQFIFC